MANKTESTKKAAMPFKTFAGKIQESIERPLTESEVQRAAAAWNSARDIDAREDQYEVAALSQAMSILREDKTLTPVQSAGALAKVIQDNEKPIDRTVRQLAGQVPAGLRQGRASQFSVERHGNDLHLIVREAYEVVGEPTESGKTMRLFRHDGRYYWPSRELVEQAPEFLHPSGRVIGFALDVLLSEKVAQRIAGKPDTAVKADDKRRTSFSPAKPAK